MSEVSISLGKAAPVSDEELALCDAMQATDRANQRFATASPARKRVIIARDVLQWLRLGKIRAQPGTYLLPQMGQRKMMDRVDGGRCDACALGAVFACAVERQDGLHEFWGQSSNDMREHLEPFFSKEQLWLIECAFEQSLLGFDEDNENHPDAITAAAFGRKMGLPHRYEDARLRMEAIMQNIIDNKGTFIP